MYQITLSLNATNNQLWFTILHRCLFSVSIYSNRKVGDFFHLTPCYEIWSHCSRIKKFFYFQFIDPLVQHESMNPLIVTPISALKPRLGILLSMTSLPLHPSFMTPNCTHSVWRKLLCTFLFWSIKVHKTQALIHQVLILKLF